MLEPFEPWRDLRLGQPTPQQLRLLGVTDQDLAFRDALMQVTAHMVRAVRLTPLGAGYYERINYPHVGDLVMEYSRGWFAQDPGVRAWAFGVLVARREEWTEPGNEGGAPERGLVHYIRWGRSNEDVQRWSNSEFKLIPINPYNFRP